MTTEDGFAARWSRRKAAARERETKDELTLDGSPPQNPLLRAKEPDVLPPATSPAGARVSDETLKGLPAIEDIGPETDLTPWLNLNVPPTWRLAAMRKMWATDSSIAQFIGPSDYAWDWNVEGGVPGFGPLRALDDVAKLLAQATGSSPWADDEPKDNFAVKGDNQAQKKAEHSVARTEEQTQPAVPAGVADIDQSCRQDNDIAESIEAKVMQASAEPEPRRRSGGALPS